LTVRQSQKYLIFTQGLVTKVGQVFILLLIETE